MARRWLCVATAAMCFNGCLFPEQPDYRRQRTTPVLRALTPPTTEVKLAKSGDTIQFEVSVLSEDDGVPLVASLYKNYLVEGTAFLSKDIFAPGSLVGDTKKLRLIRLDWTIPAQASSPGTCEQVTMVVTHYDNRDELGRPIDPNDVDALTWWLDIDSTEETVGQCPRQVGSAR